MIQNFFLPHKNGEQKEVEAPLLKHPLLGKLTYLQNVRYVSICVFADLYPPKFQPVPSNVHWFFSQEPSTQKHSL